MRMATKKPLAERFWLKVDKDAPIPEHRPELGPCWNWTGCIGGEGYGHITATTGKTITAHRFAYQSLRGQITHGMEPDHLCRNRKCVNPAHMEIVTHRENCLRGAGVGAKNLIKTHCPEGHPLSGDNLRIVKRAKGTYRACLICSRRYSRNWVRKHRSQMNAYRREWRLTRRENGLPPS